LRPVSYFLFRFTHATTALTIINDQIAGLGKGLIDLGNNANLSSRNRWNIRDTLHGPLSTINMKLTKYIHPDIMQAID
ncbi:hypothetical protein AB4365_18905, partial [Vibrio breoganii]